MPLEEALWLMTGARFIFPLPMLPLALMPFTLARSLSAKKETESLQHGHVAVHQP